MSGFKIIRASLALLPLAACPSAGTEVVPTTANPTVSGVVCNLTRLDEPADPAAGGSCARMFDECSDGLTYELKCRGGTCDCVVDGDRLGQFTASEPMNACDIEIGRLKVLCGWNPQDGSQRVNVPER
jgi:hypothetical protein